MLMPALQQARAAGQKISCINNLKQIGTTLVMYTSDYEDYLPPLYQTAGAWDQPIAPCTLSAYSLGPSRNWQDYNDHYTGGTNYHDQMDIMKCPEVENDNRASNFMGDYGYNYKHVFFSAPYAQKISSFQRGSSTVALTDAYDTGTGNSNWYVHCNSPSDAWTYGSAAQTESRHSNGLNGVYLDGHASWRPYLDYYNNVDDLWGHDDPILPNHGPDQ